MAEVILSIAEVVVALVEVEGDTVEVTGEAVSLVEVGLQGPAGLSAPGAIAPITFAWGDASPVLLATVGAGKHAYVVELIITTAFNGIGAALSVGPLAAPTELMATTDNNPASVASYETNPDKLYGSPTALYLTIIPGSGASAGAGQIRLQIEA